MSDLILNEGILEMHSDGFIKQTHDALPNRLELEQKCGQAFFACRLMTIKPMHSLFENQVGHLPTHHESDSN